MKITKKEIGFMFLGGTLVYLGASSAYLYLHMRKFRPKKVPLEWDGFGPDPYGRDHKVSTRKSYGQALYGKMDRS